MSDVRVLYVLGAPRSGTTLLGTALGQFPGVCDVGELWALWRPAYRNGDRCGCGLPVPDCPFWSAVVRSALGPDFERRGQALGALHKQRMGTKRAPHAWLHATGRWPSRDLARYAEGLERHYHAIAEVSGARLIVDSSKMAGDVLLASTLATVELSVVHLVRDPRGVAWSSRKQVRREASSGRAMDRHGTLGSALRWVAHNATAERLVLPRLGDRSRVLRYEDLLTDPVAELSSLARWLDLAPEALPLTGVPPRLVRQRVSHPVWGNFAGVATPAVPLVLDEEWRRRLPVLDRWAVTALTARWARHYGYSSSG